jgi:cupin fold WbuC family metalloprotein
MLDYGKQRQTVPEVYHCTEKRFGLKQDDLHTLLVLAEERSERSRARLCAHESPEDLVHQMFIVHPRNAYIRPHRHLKKAESMLIIEGEADYLCFDEQGSVEEIISMGSVSSKKIFYYSVSAGQFHSIRIRSDWLIFLEVTQGPFFKHDTEYAHWSPHEKEEDSGLGFIDSLRMRQKPEREGNS